MRQAILTLGFGIIGGAIGIALTAVTGGPWWVGGAYGIGCTLAGVALGFVVDAKMERGRHGS